MADGARRLIEPEKIALLELPQHARQALMIDIDCARDFLGPRWSTEHRKELQHALPHQIFEIVEPRRPAIDQAGARGGSSAQRFACAWKGYNGPVRAADTGAQLDGGLIRLG
jgi:hypothetical protein